jgi:hypothetical protein
MKTKMIEMIAEEKVRTWTHCAAKAAMRVAGEICSESQVQSRYAEASRRPSDEKRAAWVNHRQAIRGSSDHCAGGKMAAAATAADISGVRGEVVPKCEEAKGDESTAPT